MGSEQSEQNILTDYIYETTEGALSYIQAYIRGYLERKKINKLKSDMIMKIKNGLIGYLERKKVKKG